MTIHLHDLARTMHSERYSPISEGLRSDTANDPVAGSVRSIVGTALIRAGTRLLPQRPEPRRMQSVPPC